MELTAGEAWSRILERARTQLPEQSFRLWLEQTEPLALSQDLLAVGAGSEFAAEWIEDKYGPMLGEIAERVIGRPLTISFQSRSRQGASSAVERSSFADLEPARPAAPVTSQSAPVPSQAMVGTPLNERYTFERFVVGTNNQLSAAACRAVAEAPARMYNPLFIYGGVGLGKTHLMHAIGHVLLERDPSKRVAYVSSERFTNDMIAAIQ